MEKFVGLLKNVKGGPVTTAVGVVLMGFGGFGIYNTGFENVEYTSVSVGVLAYGAFLLVSKDSTYGK